MRGANRVLRFLKRYATLDTSQRRKVNKVKWNGIPWDENAEFDLQIRENAMAAVEEETGE